MRRSGERCVKAKTKAREEQYWTETHEEIEAERRCYSM